MRRAFIVLVLAVVASAALGLSADAASAVNITSGNFWLEDSTVGDGQIVINAGDQLRVEVVDGTQHTVDIAEFGIASPKMATGDVFVTPPLNTPGTYTLFCRTHLNRGHKTTLIILGSTTTTSLTTSTTTTTTTTTTTAPTSSSTAATTSTTTQAVTTTSTQPSTPTETTPTDEAAAGETATADADTGPALGLPNAETIDTGEPEASDTTIAAGMVEPEGAPVWIRSVWVGVLALIPLALLTFVALSSSET